MTDPSPQLSPLGPPPHTGLKDDARAWFETLRDRLCAVFEAIEDEAAGLEIYGPGTPGRFGRFLRNPQASS